MSWANFWQQLFNRPGRSAQPQWSKKIYRQEAQPNGDRIFFEFLNAPAETGVQTARETVHSFVLDDGRRVDLRYPNGVVEEGRRVLGYWDLAAPGWSTTPAWVQRKTFETVEVAFAPNAGTRNISTIRDRPHTFTVEGKTFTNVTMSRVETTTNRVTVGVWVVQLPLNATGTPAWSKDPVDQRQDRQSRETTLTFALYIPANQLGTGDWQTQGMTLPHTFTHQGVQRTMTPTSMTRGWDRVSSQMAYFGRFVLPDAPPCPPCPCLPEKTAAVMAEGYCPRTDPAGNPLNFWLDTNFWLGVLMVLLFGAIIIILTQWWQRRPPGARFPVIFPPRRSG